MQKIFALVLLVTLISCSQSKNNSSTKTYDGWSFELLDKAKSHWSTMPESGVIIISQGQEIANWGETNQKVKLSSARKSLLSILYGNYVENGTIDLDKTLKELNIKDSPDSISELEQSATVRMLMQARSGIYHNYIGGRPGMRVGQPQRNSHEPGTYWYYNNWDFNALGTIFEQETESTIGSSFKEQIADKIGMSHFEPNDVYYLQGKQSIHSQYHFRMSAADLAKFGQLIIQEGRWNNEKIVSGEWIRESTTSYSQTNRGTGYGYMWWTAHEGSLFDGVTLPDKSFAAFGAVGKYLVIIPEYDLVIVHLQTRDWPDNASELPESELPTEEQITETHELGPLIKLILDSRKN